MASVPILHLPSELILQILSLISASELAITSRTCRQLRQYCLEDNLWRAHIQVNVPGLTITSPSPCATFRDLYLSVIPFWHLPRGKFWFSNTEFTGKLMIIRYSQARRRIEGCLLAAKRENLTWKPWSWNPNVLIFKWDPIVRPDLDLSAFVFTTDELGAMSYSLRAIGATIPVTSDNGGQGQRTICIQRREQQAKHITSEPIWPPMSLPAQNRTYHTRENYDIELPRLEELSESTFMFTECGPGGERSRFRNSSMYATLPAEVYTPTAKKPWRGIYCGDYMGHGCEFIVVMQPNHPDPLPENAWLKLMSLGSQQNQSDAWYQMLKKQAPLSSSSASSSGVLTTPYGQLSLTETGDSSGNLQPESGAAQAITEVSSQERPSEEIIRILKNSQNTGTTESSSSTESSPSFHQGCIKAVKLTGDPNVPRGEITFVAPDISDIGLIRIAEDHEFQGARVVRSVGHIAEHGFRNGKCKFI